MARAELPLVLTTSRWVDIGVTGFFAVCAFSLTRAGLNGWEDWSALVGCSVLVLTGVAAVVVHPRVEVTETSITDVGLFSRTSFELRRCGRFYPRQYWGRLPRWVVTFDYDAVQPRGNRRRAKPRRRPIGNSCLQTYGHNAEELAALLNNVRDHARRT